MKKTGILFLLMFLGLYSYAQEQGVNSLIDNCRDTFLHSEMVDYNSDFLQQGFNIQLFQVVEFPKNTYVPISIQLEKGKMYQFNFVMNRFFQNASVAFIGKDKKEFFKDKWRGKTSQQHWFSKSFVAPYTGEYWLIMSQKAKDREIVCGGLSVLKVN